MYVCACTCVCVCACTCVCVLGTVGGKDGRTVTAGFVFVWVGRPKVSVYVCVCAHVGYM